MAVAMLHVHVSIHNSFFLAVDDKYNMLIITYLTHLRLYKICFYVAGIESEGTVLADYYIHVVT